MWNGASQGGMNGRGARGFRARRQARLGPARGQAADPWAGIFGETDGVGEIGELAGEDAFGELEGEEEWSDWLSGLGSWFGFGGDTATAGQGKATSPSPAPPPVRPAVVSASTSGGARAASSTSGFFKDSPRLQTAPLAPSSPITVDPKWSRDRQALARTYNRLGGLMQTIAAELGVEVEAALAVWRVESGGREHTVDRAVIRFEVHYLWDRWGKSNPSVFDAHFRHGGRAGVPGKRWENHQFRESPSGAWETMHTGKQASEYRALQLATRLAGEEIAVRCISLGGPQIMGSHYADIGYRTAKEMYNAFQASERAHVLGFFDFCRTKPAPQKGGLFEAMRTRDWSRFAKYYNGSGQVGTYGPLLATAYAEAKKLGIGTQRETGWFGEWSDEAAWSGEDEWSGEGDWSGEASWSGESPWSGEDERAGELGWTGESSWAGEEEWAGEDEWAGEGGWAGEDEWAGEGAWSGENGWTGEDEWAGEFEFEFEEGDGADGGSSPDAAASGDEPGATDGGGDVDGGTGGYGDDGAGDGGWSGEPPADSGTSDCGCGGTGTCSCGGGGDAFTTADGFTLRLTPAALTRIFPRRPRRRRPGRRAAAGIQHLARNARRIGSLRSRRTGRRFPVFSGRAGGRRYRIVAAPRQREMEAEIVAVLPGLAQHEVYAAKHPEATEGGKRRRGARVGITWSGPYVLVPEAKGSPKHRLAGKAGKPGPSAGSGVYVVYRGGVPIYVGESGNVAGRWTDRLRLLHELDLPANLSAYEVYVGRIKPEAGLVILDEKGPARGARRDELVRNDVESLLIRMLNTHLKASGKRLRNEQSIAEVRASPRGISLTHTNPPPHVSALTRQGGSTYELGGAW